MGSKGDVEAVLERLRSLSDRKILEGMARFGISTRGTLGIPMPVLRGIARELGRDHALAEGLWASGVHEARLLAGLVDDPRLVTEEQLDRWVSDFDSWDVCDQVCGALFDRTPFAPAKALEWARREEEFVKRAGFVLMATLSVHDKKAPDGAFDPFLEEVERGADDGRNFVKKAVNWALRQVGKRNPKLNRRAVRTARKLLRAGSPSARWIASDALRELQGEAVLRRLRERTSRRSRAAGRPGRRRAVRGGAGKGDARSASRHRRAGRQGPGRATKT